MSQISFADWELLQQGLTLEPLLQAISNCLDDQKEMIEAVRRDLQRGLKKQAAVKLGLEDGNRLRVDTAVVQSDIHHPTDNTLLWDVVRVVTRLVGRLREAVPQRIQAFSNRTRVARRRMQEIQRMTAKERQE